MYHQKYFSDSEDHLTHLALLIMLFLCLITSFTSMYLLKQKKWTQ